VIKKKGFQYHRGPARVFDHEEDAMQAAPQKRIKPSDVVVIRYEGLEGGPGDAQNASGDCRHGRRVTGRVLVQLFERRQTEPIFNFSLRGKRCFSYLQDHGLWAGDLRCVELSFFDFVRQLDPLAQTGVSTEHLIPP